jgi:dolichyl-phosphate beta-glucosyltransferase
MKKNIELSLIIPAYNEGKIIKDTLERVYKFLTKKDYGWEVIVVDDGSDDNTTDLVRIFADKNEGIRLIKFPENRGKGAALKAGVKEAKGKCIVYSDADLSVPLKYIDRTLLHLKNSNLVIGSRRAEGAEILVHQSWLRESLGRIFTLLTRCVLVMDISDFTCGFKGFRSKAGKDIFGRALLERWAYDSELLFLAKKLRYKITELPVSWKNRKDTRVVLGRAVITSFIDLIRIRLNDFLGRYDG